MSIETRLHAVEEYLKILQTKSQLDYYYPVGSYYETSDASFNPNTAWGGTWVQETEQVRTASWTAASTNANNAKVTNSLMLPAGTYIGWIKCPACSQETVLAFSTNLGLATGGMFARAQSVVSFTFTLSAETEIYAQTNMSQATNYTYLERGYLKVVRISSHIGNRWHRTA